MKRLLILMAALAGCADATEEEGGFFKPPVDGGDSPLGDMGRDGGVGPNAPGPAPVALFFQAGQDGYAAAPDGTAAVLICPAGRIVPSDNAEGVLCIPNDEDAPLKLHAPTGGEALAEVADWSPSERYPSRISPEGSQVATRVFRGGKDVVSLYSDTGTLADAIEARELLGFVTENMLIIGEERAPKLWVRGEAPLPLNAVAVLPAGPVPAGVVYEIGGGQPKVRFLNGRSTDETDLGVGHLGAVSGTRVLIFDEDRESGRIIDLDDPDIDLEVSLPSQRFDEFGIEAKFIDNWSLQIEMQTAGNCGGGREPGAVAATRTVWLDIVEDEYFPIARTDATPHAAWVDGAKQVGLVLEVDNCGIPTGAGDILDLSDDEPVARPVTELVDGAISAADLSRDGKYLAVSTRAGVFVVDLTTDAVVPIDVTGRGGAVAFR